MTNLLQVEEMLKTILSYDGVVGFVVVNNAGTYMNPVFLHVLFYLKEIYLYRRFVRAIFTSIHFVAIPLQISRAFRVLCG